MNTAKNIYFWTVFSLANMAAAHAYAETVYYTLDNVILDETPTKQMTGIFSWTFNAGDFENGVGQFELLDIPYTLHNQDDLDATIDITQSIEITLAGSVHDDGVDISLVLAQPLTPTTSSLIVIGEGESKYEIGGNGFHVGLFVSGTISPTNLLLNIAGGSPGYATLSWEPDIPGLVLQETPGLSPTNWTDSTSGGTNPVVVPATAPMTFYRLAKP